MTPTLRRLLAYLGLALLEVTPPALALTLWGAPASWGTLYLVALAAAVADWLARRLVPERLARPLLALAALLLALACARAVVPGADLIPALFDRTSPHNLIAYAGLLAGLYASWRGMRLALYESVGLRELFERTMGLSLLMLLVGGLGGVRAQALMAAATAELLCGFAAGLGTVALARAAEPGETTGRSAGWRGAAPTLATIALVLLAGLGLTALISEEARQLVFLAGELLALGLTALLVPLVMLLAPPLEWLLRVLHAGDLLLLLQGFARDLQELQQGPPLDMLQELDRLVPWARPLLSWVARLLPILALLALVWLMARRRRPPPRVAADERVSLFSWAGLADDIQELLGRLRRAPDHGLRAALERLRGDDPDSRIRRSYIRMLLAAEAREHPRPAPSTPREFRGEAAATLEADPQVLDALTAAYEQARYQPGSAGDADAEAAEQAWAALERSSAARK